MTVPVVEQAPPTAGLQAHVVRHRPGFTLDVQIACAPGRVLAVLGPNGAGKTTLLQALAGLEPPDDGLVRLTGRVLDCPATSTWVRPERRSVAWVPQSGLLFPHLSALDNVAFGLRARGSRPTAARRVAAGWLDRFDLASHAEARPDQLSGGQAQRVALARALATSPQLLLMDEPLSALDAGTRAAVRAELAGHLAQAGDAATLLVTHDALDALVLADQLVVLEGGRVVQAGTPAQVAARPATDYVAQLVGVTLCRGTARGATVALTGGGQLVVSLPADGPVAVAVPPTAVALYRERPEGTVRNAWPVVVASLQQHASGVRVTLAGPPDVAADVTAAAVAELGLVPGSRMWAGVKASELTAYPVA